MSESPQPYRVLARKYRPQNFADLIGQAARLAVGVSRAQAFLDGNKRTAFFAAAVFLNLNGLRFTGDSLAGAMLLDELADPSIGDDEADERFEAWLREHVDR